MLAGMQTGRNTIGTQQATVGFTLDFDDLVQTTPTQIKAATVVGSVVGSVVVGSSGGGGVVGSSGGSSVVVGGGGRRKGRGLVVVLGRQRVGAGVCGRTIVFRCRCGWFKGNGALGNVMIGKMMMMIAVVFFQLVPQCLTRRRVTATTQTFQIVVVIPVVVVVVVVVGPRRKERRSGETVPRVAIPIPTTTAATR